MTAILDGLAGPDLASPRAALPAAPLVSPLPAARRQTQAFLHDAKQTCHVYLMADVDATRMVAAREQTGGSVSIVSYIVKAAADILADVPEARAVLRGGRRPRLAAVEDVHAKVLFDKTVDGVRCVVSGTVPDPGASTVAEISDAIAVYKAAPVDSEGPFKQVRLLQRLPLWLGRLVYRAALRDPVRRARLQGTFAVTSVGQEHVRAIFPMIAGTLGFGVGRIVTTPVVRDGEVAIAPVLTLSLAFDHRVLDGALAAELLASVKARLETWEMS